MFFIGRVRGHMVAMEGAQKLKELSYVHAEAYPTPELKHGPLALIAPDVADGRDRPADHLLDKNRSSLEQVKARGGPLVVAGRTRARAWPTS